MEQSDLHQIVLIEQNSFSQPWSLKSFKDSIGREDTIFLAAEYKTTIAGYGGFYYNENEADITNIAVDELFRGKKIGWQIISLLKQKAKDLGVTTMFLEVRESNTPARMLYLKAGFCEIGIRKNFYKKPAEDAVIMSCDLVCCVSTSDSH